MIRLARVRRSSLSLAALAAVALLALGVGAASEGAASRALLALTVILITAKLGGDVAIRLRQPPVLGELVAGVMVGNLPLLGVHGLGWLGDDAFLEVLAEVGVVLMLFEVGLESTLGQMARVGKTALGVATIGVVAPMLLGLGVGAWLLPNEPFFVHLFLGAILTATSVGITARVLQDLGASRSPEARVILGAAVIDDVLGLVVLAAVSGVIASVDAGEAPGFGPVAWIAAKALLFLGGAALLGVFVMPRALRRAARLRGTGVMLGLTLAFCFALSWGAGAVGLAPIVGAFAAGLVLEDAHYEPFREREPRQLEELVHPIVQFLAPVFFVLMGFHVDLRALADPAVLGLAAALTVAGVVGKQACMLAVRDPAIRRLPVGVGMIPRGEVGLIFASVGARLSFQGQPVVSTASFSAVVVVVIVTTLVTPPLLTWSFRRGAATTVEG